MCFYTLVQISYELMITLGLSMITVYEKDVSVSVKFNGEIVVCLRWNSMKWWSNFGKDWNTKRHQHPLRLYHLYFHILSLPLVRKDTLFSMKQNCGESESPIECAKLHNMAGSSNRDHSTRSLSSSPSGSTVNCSPGSHALLQVTHPCHSIGITLIACSCHIYMSIILQCFLRAHPVRGESLIQHNANREVTTRVG